ncbi:MULTISPECIES: baseplate J/gp47 family protein [Aneurinibacillus]|nr:MULTISPECIES: baseplate J/gp47 family protein [Aneurinibacillus]AMA74014.1 hypothetical protein ACH33_14985 [Aneurinibacillus sp. XH2]MED0737214.1 baseplate J/gp47 family protein [Aneurinibacillus thermoaerophilus]
MELDDKMLLLLETPEMIYERVANRVKGEIPIEQGELFYIFAYPICQEIAEQQEQLQYMFIQGFPLWADGEFLDRHGEKEFIKLERLPGEDDESYRKRILTATREEEGNGRRRDYERWARDAGAGGAFAVEHARHENSIDVYITDYQGNPATPELCATVREKMESKRIAVHDLQVLPALTNAIHVEARLHLLPDAKPEEVDRLILERLTQYVQQTSLIRYHVINTLLFVPGVVDWESCTVNGGTDNIERPEGAINVVTWRRIE